MLIQPTSGKFSGDKEMRPACRFTASHNLHQASTQRENLAGSPTDLTYPGSASCGSVHSDAPLTPSTEVLPSFPSTCSYQVSLPETSESSYQASPPAPVTTTRDHDDFNTANLIIMKSSFSCKFAKLRLTNLIIWHNLKLSCQNP